MIRNVHRSNFIGGRHDSMNSTSQALDESVDSKHAKGALHIKFGSDQFNLVFNIMLGIKRSVDCVFESPYYQINEFDYVSKFTHQNQW